MNWNLRNFIKDYTDELLDGRAAIFAGAGLSVGAGVVSWKELLRSEAENIGIDVDIEHDLVTVAQYIYNESNSRNKITRLIKQHINSKGELTENHRLLAQLPIDVYWTTNYDEYIEKSLDQINKIYDVKKSVQDLSIETKNALTTIYKMHGDINHAHNAVLIKDDFEIYSRKNELFTLALKADLISKTFLFIGFSFDDPNLESILSRVRIMLEGNQRTHYCFLKEVLQTDSEFKQIKDSRERKSKFDYAKNKQYLKIKDLNRYGIKAILVKSYDDIPKILKRIVELYRSNNIFISGSHADPEDKEFLVNGTPQSFTTNLAKRISQNEFKVTTGFGIGVGSDVINGVLKAMQNSNSQSLDSSLSMRPFPISINDKHEREKAFTAYRELILNEPQIAIFVFGNKIEEGELIYAKGVQEEFEIARHKKKFIIPVGVTGYQSKLIWETINSDFNQYYPDSTEFRELFEKLNEANIDENELINVILNLIKLIRNHIKNYELGV